MLTFPWGTDIHGIRICGSPENPLFHPSDVAQALGISVEHMIFDRFVNKMSVLCVVTNIGGSEYQLLTEEGFYMATSSRSRRDLKLRQMVLEHLHEERAAVLRKLNEYITRLEKLTIDLSEALVSQLNSTKSPQKLGAGASDKNDDFSPKVD